MLPDWPRLETDLKALSFFSRGWGSAISMSLPRVPIAPLVESVAKRQRDWRNCSSVSTRREQAGNPASRGVSSLPGGGPLLYESGVNCLLLPVVAVLFAAFTLSVPTSAQADTFGAGTNAFDVDFVPIGNAGNAADTTGYGAVAYSYRAGTHEISQDAIDKATAGGMANVTAGPWTGDQPAANLNWYEAAAFVNFLNTNSGKTAAYDLSWSGTAWIMALWSSDQAGMAGG